MSSEPDQNLIVYFGGQYVPLREARIGILTHALHYGTGVFEGIRAHWDPGVEEMFLMRPLEHFERWKRNCGILRIEVPATPEQLCGIAIELLRRNKLHTDVYIRPLAYKCAERVGVSTDNHDAFAIVALPFGQYLHSDKGLHVCVSSWRRIEDNAIPARGKICGAYVNSALASDDARRAGFDEAIMLNENGHVAEGSTSNIFMVRKGRLITPPVTENLLEGITRGSVMELAERELSMRVTERPIDRSELYEADELFFSGTAVGVAPVVEVDHRPVKDATVGPITGQLRHLYVEAVHGRLRDYGKWLVPVFRSGIESGREKNRLEKVSAD